MKHWLNSIFAAIAAVALLVLSGCGTSKNTPMSRNWQAFTTRYNVYYNGKTHYDEQLKEMEGKYEDDYSRRVLIHPAEARADQKQHPRNLYEKTGNAREG